jgi:hypothetical protein
MRYTYFHWQDIFHETNDSVYKSSILSDNMANLKVDWIKQTGCGLFNVPYRYAIDVGEWVSNFLKTITRHIMSLSSDLYNQWNSFKLFMIIRNSFTFSNAWNHGSVQYYCKISKDASWIAKPNSDSEDLLCTCFKKYCFHCWETTFFYPWHFMFLFFVYKKAREHKPTCAPLQTWGSKCPRPLTCRICVATYSLCRNGLHSANLGWFCRLHQTSAV